MNIEKNTVKKSTAVLPKDMTREQAKADLERKRQRDREIVRGKFIFHECPGGSMEFVYKAYEKDPLERYSLQDGEVYSLPLGVARHLNKNCWYPVHSYAQSEQGLPSVKIGQKIRRCSFQSLEFVDTDDISPVGVGEIVTVEKIGIMD
jgi:hypothetical protein